MPNVLTIVLDDVNGWLTLAGSYGGQLHTPNIDRLASMGVSFTEAHAAVRSATRRGPRCCQA